MIFIFCVLLLAACWKGNDFHLLDIPAHCMRRQRSSSRQDQIAGKINDSHLLDIPARCVRSQGFSFEAGSDCKKNQSFSSLGHSLSMYAQPGLFFRGRSRLQRNSMIFHFVEILARCIMRHDQIAMKFNDFHILDTPAHCVRSHGFYFSVGADCKEN